ncbi:MAG: hypothetical protein AAGA46_01285 [Cyanobacteria bacterium P01_F01_bin.13]
MPVSQQKSTSVQHFPHDLALKVLKRLPEEHRHSITPQQLAALQSASAEKKNKSIVRAYLGPFCFSLALGRKQQINSKTINQSMLTTVLCLMVSMVGMSCIISLMKFRYGYQSAYANTSFHTQDEEFHPTVLPFRKDQSNCEKNGGMWTEGECVDYAHSPRF